MATSVERSDNTDNGLSSSLHSPSQIATTSAVTLDQTSPDHHSSKNVKEEDEEAKLFASLVNGIQTGAVSAGITALPITSSEDASTAWTNAMSSLQGVNADSFPSLDLVQSMANGALGTISSDPLSMALNNNVSDLTAAAAQPISEDMEDDIPPEPISAYAKLEFPGFSYYIQTLDFTIGRRPAEFRVQNDESHPQHITDKGKSLGDVDVDLGPVKSISRFHVRIFHQEPNWPPGYNASFAGTQVRFVLQVLGRNGCFVDDVPIGKGSIVPLGKRTKIQIAERVFYFVLPPTHSLHIAMDEEGEEGTIGSSVEEEEESEEGDIEDEESSSGSLGGSSEEEDEQDEEEEESETELTMSSGNKKKPLPKKKSDIQIGQGKGGKGKGKGVEPMEVDESTKNNTIRKRKRGEPMEDDETGVLKVGTPIGVEALNLNKRKKKGDAGGEIAEPLLSPSGKGKGAGKAAIVSAAMARARADVEAIQAAAEANAALIGDITPSTPMGSKTDNTSNEATPISSASKLSASDKSKKPLPPAGPGIKPDKSNMDLIREAMNGPLSVSRGGKMALQEIYEYLTSTYEWFRNNSRANGRDWHSAIRHAVGNARDMDRIPRKPHEPGKGVFYAFANSDAAKAARAEAAEGSAVQSDTTNAATPTPPPTAITVSPSVSTPQKNTTVKTNAKSTAPQSSTKPDVLAAKESTKAEAVNTEQTSSSNNSTKSDSVPPSTPASAIAADGRVRIVVGKAPDDALAQMAAAPKASITQSIEALFGGPPIVHHEGTLFLSPIVFGTMSAQEISDIGGKGAQQALATLQAKLVAHLQSKMTAGAVSSPTPPPAAAATASSPVVGVNALQSPGSNLPGNAKAARPPTTSAKQTNQVSSNPTGTTARPALVRPGNTTSTTTGRPPIQPRPPIARPTGTGMANAIRPSVPVSSSSSSTSIARPTTTNAVRPPMGRPPLTTTTIARPTGQTGSLARPNTAASAGSSLIRPGRPPLQPRPAVQGPSASIARPPMTTTVPTTTAAVAASGVRPTGTIPTGGLARPANSLARPAAGTTVGRPPLVRPGSTSVITGNALVRPGGGVGVGVGVGGITANRPPLHTAQRPLGTSITNNNSATGVRPSIATSTAARPGAGRPPLSARPRPPLPGQQVGRPPSTATVAASQAGTAKGALSTGTPIGRSSSSSIARPILGSTSTSAANVRPAAQQRPPVASTSTTTTSTATAGSTTTTPATTTNVASVNSQNGTTSSSSSSAAAAAAAGNGSGASQSDMAALLAMLTGGKLDNSKLTPAQHELLQRAGRLAAEQQKAQQQKTAAAVIGGGRSPSPIKSSVNSSNNNTPVRPTLMTKTTPKTTTSTTEKSAGEATTLSKDNSSQQQQQQQQGSK